MRDRLLLPIFIPVGAAAAIFLLIFSVGKILLEIDPRYATAIATLVAVLILAVCSLLAAGPRIPATPLYVVTGIPVSIIIAIGLFLAVRPEASTGAAHGGPVAAAATTSITQIATDNKFSVTAATVPANTEITLEFDNRGAALHNWRLLNVKDKDGKDIATQLLAGGKTETLKFTIAQPGTYTFHCDVHPTEMKGELTVTEGSAPAGATAGGAASGGAGGGITLVATDNKFDQTALTVKANEAATVTFQNKGSALHNWHVLGVQDTSGKEVKGELIGGGKSETITFTIAKPGTYDYQCDVHPVEMKGKLTVQ